MGTPTPIELNSCWTLYYHQPDDNRWGIESYVKLISFKTVEEFAITFLTINEFWDKGMFFLMRNSIQPMWEDPANKNGGCYSMKVLKSHIQRVWVQTVIQTIGEFLVKDPSRANDVTGISISPKKNYCIIRVWISKTDTDVTQFNFNSPEYSEIFFKPH